MTAFEADALVDRIRKLWPRWSPTTEERGMWSEMLEGYAESTGQAAVEAMWHESDRLSPTPKAFSIAVRGVLRDLPRRQVIRTERSCLSSIWIQCIEGPAIGRFVPVPVRLDRDPPERHRLMEIAERMAESHAERYSGTWQVVSDADERQMLQARAGLRAKKEHADADKA